MKELDKELEKLIRKFDKSGKSDPHCSAINNKAISELLAISDEMIKEFADRFDTDVIKVFRLPSEIIEMFFNERKQGFLLMIANRYVFVVTEEPNFIFIYGVDDKNKNLNASFLSRSRQLLRMQLTEMEGDIKYKDNTSMLLDPHDVIIQVLKWGLRN